MAYKIVHEEFWSCDRCSKAEKGLTTAEYPRTWSCVGIKSHTFVEVDGSTLEDHDDSATADLCEECTNALVQFIWSSNKAQ